MSHLAIHLLHLPMNNVMYGSSMLDRQLMSGLVKLTILHEAFKSLVIRFTNRTKTNEMSLKSS